MRRGWRDRYITISLRPMALHHATHGMSIQQLDQGGFELSHSLRIERPKALDGAFATP